MSAPHTVESTREVHHVVVAMPSPFVLLGLRPRLCEQSAGSGHHHGRAVAEGDQFAHPPSGVSAHEEAVLGEALLGRQGQTVSSGSQTDEMVAQFVEEAGGGSGPRLQSIST